MTAAKTFDSFFLKMRIHYTLFLVSSQASDAHSCATEKGTLYICVEWVKETNTCPSSPIPAIEEQQASLDYGRMPSMFTFIIRGRTQGSPLLRSALWRDERKTRLPVPCQILVCSWKVRYTMLLCFIETITIK